LPKGFFDGVTEVVKKKYQSDPEFIKFIEQAMNFCKFLRNARHAIEHVKTTQYLDVRDYTLDPVSGDIIAPTIEIIHADTPQDRINLKAYTDQVAQSLINIAEPLIAYLCAFHIKETARLISIGEIPEESRHNKMIRFGYILNINGQVVQLS
jgi:hypothetical protein